MAGLAPPVLLLRLSLSTTCCVLLLLLMLASHPALAKTDANNRNDAPCQQSKGNNSFSTFVKKHLPPGTPNTANQSAWNAWFKFIKDNTGCERPTQSFIPSDDLDRVKAVCSSQGGKVYKDNLCISRKPFKFFTVRLRSKKDTCGIKNVTEETKYLILACENVDNQCVPVHFEGNPNDAKPDNNARACQDDIKGGAGAMGMTTCLWLLTSVILIVNAH